MGGTRDARGFPHSSVGKESTCNTGDHNSIPGSGRSAGEGIGYPLQFLGFPCGSVYVFFLPKEMHIYQLCRQKILTEINECALEIIDNL